MLGTRKLYPTNLNSFHITQCKDALWNVEQNIPWENAVVCLIITPSFLPQRCAALLINSNAYQTSQVSYENIYKRVLIKYVPAHTSIYTLSIFQATFYALGIKDESIDKSQFLDGQSCDCMEDCDQTLYSQVTIKIFKFVLK